MVILMLTECAIIEIERGIISNNRDYSGAFIRTEALIGTKSYITRIITIITFYKSMKAKGTNQRLRFLQMCSWTPLSEKQEYKKTETNEWKTTKWRQVKRNIHAALMYL